MLLKYLLECIVAGARVNWKAINNIFLTGPLGPLNHLHLLSDLPSMTGLGSHATQQLSMSPTVCWKKNHPKKITWVECGGQGGTFELPLCDLRMFQTQTWADLQWEVWESPQTSPMDSLKSRMTFTMNSKMMGINFPNCLWGREKGRFEDSLRTSWSLCSHLHLSLLPVSIHNLCTVYSWVGTY